jgi:hypothetical protein
MSQRLRGVEAAAPVGDLECAECGARGSDGFRADYGAGDEEVPDLELVVLCEPCWEREFG